MNARFLLVIGSILLFISAAAQIGVAAGTAAGTTISNQAQVQYQAGTNTRTATSNTVTLYVAHRVAGSSSPASRTDAGVDNQTVHYPFTFKNQGNRSDNFNITFNSNTGYTVAMYRDVNHDGVYDAGDALTTTTGSLAADDSVFLLVRVQVAAGRPDNEAVTITATLTSTAVDDAGNHIVVANPGAAFQFSVNFTVHRPVIVFTGSSSDVTSNASRIPGASVTYTMNLQNTGSGAVSGSSTVTFVLDAHMHFVSATNSGALTGADGSGNGGTVTWSFAPALLAVGQPVISFNVVVQPEQVTNNGAGVAAGTTVYAMTTANSTQTRVQYNDGVSTSNQDNANSFNFVVGTASGCVITQVTPDGTGEPGNAVDYHYTLKNTGNASDGFDFSQANDATGNLDVAHVFSQTAGGASIASITGVASGATVDFYVRVTVPTSATDGQTIKRNLTATTRTGSPTAPTGGSTSSTDNLVTTVHAANVSITIAGPVVVAGTDLNGQAVPGSVLRYTVTIINGGTATATNISSSNLTPHLTTNTVVTTSVNIDANGDGTYELTGVTMPYSSGGVQATLAGGILTLQFPSIASGAQVGYQYDVAVQ
jgi:uncharacterized repeat protein (TIGR01451 family)